MQIPNKAADYYLCHKFSLRQQLLRHGSGWFWIATASWITLFYWVSITVQLITITVSASADKSLPRPTSRCILFDGENISFDASLVIQGFPRVHYFRRVFLMLKYTDTTPNTYIQSWTVTEIMAREVWNFDSCYTLTDCQIHIETGRNMWFL